MPSLVAYAKKMRFELMYYIMLVLVFPLSYLIVAVSSDKNEKIWVYVVGMYVSMLISLFINLQAAHISATNTIEIIESYSVYKVSPLDEFVGESAFHALISFFLLIPAILMIYLTGNNIMIFRLIIFLFITFYFMHELSVFLGSLIANPNIANPLINLLYMIIIMITPLYTSIENTSGITKWIYFFNPISHIKWMFDYAVGVDLWFPKCVSYFYLFIIGICMMLWNKKRWTNMTAIEKLTII